MPWFISTMPIVFLPACLRKELGAQPREVEARHDVGNDDHLVAVDLADALLAVGGVGDGQHRVGVRVIDVLVRQDRVQNGLDRRRGRGRRASCAWPARSPSADRLSASSCASFSKVRHPHRREPGLLDRLQVPAAALDVEDLLLVADEIASRAA